MQLFRFFFLSCIRCLNEKAKMVFIKERNLFLVFVLFTFCSSEMLTVHNILTQTQQTFLRRNVCTNNTSTLLPLLQTSIQFMICMESEGDACARNYLMSSFKNRIEANYLYHSTHHRDNYLFNGSFWIRVVSKCVNWCTCT